MTGKSESWLGRFTRRRGGDRWSSLASDSGELGPERLRRLRGEAVTLRHVLDRFLANTRGAAERTPPVDTSHLPGATDWYWRSDVFHRQAQPAALVSPANGTQFAEGVTVWHDDPQCAMILRQTRNPPATDLTVAELPPFALQIEALGCEGQFISLSMDVPAEALDGLGADYIIRADMRVWSERPSTAYARLNIENGPNTDSIQQGFQPAPQGAPDLVVAEFDLAYAEVNDRRLSKMWLDIILEKPRMNAIELREIILSRQPRAQF